MSVAASTDRAIFLELHPATISGVKLVIRKKEWIKQWLSTTPGGKAILKLQPTYIWAASGKNYLPPTSQELKRLAAKGIRFEPRRVRV